MERYARKGFKGVKEVREFTEPEAVWEAMKALGMANPLGGAPPIGAEPAQKEKGGRWSAALVSNESRLAQVR